MFGCYCCLLGRLSALGKWSYDRCPLSAPSANEGSLLPLSSSPAHLSLAQSPGIYISECSLHPEIDMSERVGSDAHSFLLECCAAARQVPI